MNRKERRAFKKKLGKELGPRADRIISYHKQYEGVDDKKLEELVLEETKNLSFSQLMLLMEYIDNTIAPK
jgi:hypothetical protein